MNAKAVDILGKIEPLALTDYSYIAVCGFTVEIRGGVLTIRNPNGGMYVRPVVSNSVEIIPTALR